MKTVSMILSSLILLAAPVSFAKPVLVSDADAKNLKAAMDLYTYSCENWSPWDVQEQLQKASRVYVDESGIQPVLMFELYSIKQNERVRISVRTDAPLTKITEIRYVYEIVKSVNRGTVVKPRIVQEFAVKQDFTCSNFKLK